MIPIKCACGAELKVLELYAGGHVVCHACGSSVSVPADSRADDRFRFHCPHCETRVVARKSSAGKKSQCPACEKVYVVPDPPEEADITPANGSRRIELATDDLALRFGLPFPVGKLEPVTAAPPQPRFLHTAPVEGDDAHQKAVPLPAHIVPKINEPKTDEEDSTPGERPAERPAEGPPITAELDSQPEVLRASAVLADRRPDEAAQTSARPRVSAPLSWGDSSTAPTAAAIPQMALPTKPASVGELRVLSGNCCGQCIRLDFHHFVVGAERDCDLRPASPLLSRHHCVFKKDEYSLRIRDLGSTNGTFVNGRRIFSEAILKPGDEVTIGDVMLHVLLPRAPQVIHSMPDSAPSISDFVIL
jgi:hypothetical protein